MRYLNVVSFLCVFLVVWLGGCGSDNPDDEVTTSISALNIQGVEVVGGVSILDPNLNQGAFVISWNVQSSDPYRLDFYLSDDSTLSTDDDINFFGRNCGTSLGCRATGEASCSYTTENLISCDTSSTSNLTDFLDSIPKSAFLIVRACNGLFTDCEDSVQSVELR